ncbi:MAG: hypothetical protein ACRCYO_09280 [Bacteroidia bacterium]
MRLNEETKNNVFRFLESFHTNTGKTLYFREAISTNEGNFDRHFTSFSSTAFKLVNVATRYSGARIMFDGEKLNYEISLDCLIHFEEKENEFTFIEAYTEKVYRRTILKVTDENS